MFFKWIIFSVFYSFLKSILTFILTTLNYWLALDLIGMYLKSILTSELTMAFYEVFIHRTRTIINPDLYWFNLFLKWIMVSVSVRPKPGFGLGNLKLGSDSVPISEPKLFFWNFFFRNSSILIPKIQSFYLREVMMARVYYIIS